MSAEYEYAQYYEDTYGMPNSVATIADECKERGLNAELVFRYIDELATARAIRWEEEQERLSRWNPEAEDYRNGGLY